MPKNPKDADCEFFDKLTKDTFGKNEELKEYYVKIESLYNGNSICLSGQEDEVTEGEATEVIEDDQGSESDICSNNDQVYNIFSSKISDILVKLLNQSCNFSLLQHDNIKQCVYFKYWFYDKILKNIFSDVKLEDFYEALEADDKDYEDQYVRVPIIQEDREEPREEFFEQPEEEDVEELVDGNSLNSEEYDIEENEDAHEHKNQHKHRDKYYGGNNILLSLGNSNNCNIYKLNLNQIIDIKLLYDYFENYDDKTKITNVEKKIINSRYCGSFNNLIELYNKKIECKSYYSDNEFCHELEEYWNNYSHQKISTLSCNTEKSASYPQQESAYGKELQEERPTSHSPGRGASSDSSLSGDLSDTEHEGIKEVCFTYFLISPKPANCNSTTQLGCDAIGEKHTYANDERSTEFDHPHTPISSLLDKGRRYSKDSEASFLCPNGGLPENTYVHTEPDMNSQEDTGSTNTIVSSASSVLGVSALAFMLYKFTPLGSLINNRRGGMDTWDINEEGYDENLLFSSALGNTNSNNNNYSIGYYSLGNT
ncbi:PIR Superfamily Protein [Plasmodium ovale wallikeri]|uniref:PIR Superfamily Protein n=1 Tax=Plasmodium ovale wallikeri TaxID=864142 RepID=A0A1A9AF39_PLAOA|nr:PIR Superfamily Protein [Plasmodium ovale wallikeri]SBT58617.1 PIR Superfamily Protein [Plasmodium ovale wallikeri]